MTRGKEDLDPSEFVMDELAGQFLALWAISYPSWAHGIDITALWPGWVTAFVLFRLFDILKPGPVGWADRKKGAVGVMMDDVIAGIFAAIGVALLAGLSHGVLGL
jgi:phosphatidylglycerophosphatase A